MSKHSLPPAKRSTRAPYKSGEPWHARHKRRQQIAITEEDRLRSQLAGLEVEISTHNGGAHWKIRLCAGKVLVEWWPETGRLVTDGNWHNPRKAHDVDQAARWARRARAKYIARTEAAR